MKDVLFKLRLMLQPLLIVTLGTVGFYSLLHYLYIITGQDLLNQEIIQFFIPIVLAMVPVYIWLYPRFKLVKPKKDKDQSFNLALFAWIAVMAPLIIAQMYIDKSVGSLAKLDNISQINSLPKSRFYEVKNCYFNKEYAGFHGAWEVSGRHNENLNFKLFVALPVFKDIEDTANTSAVWLGKIYSTSVSNSGTDDEKEKKYDDFRKRSIADFDSRDFKEFTYLIRVPKSGDLSNFVKAIDRSGKSHPVELSILIAETEPFDQRGKDNLPWIFYSFGIAFLIFTIILLFQNLDEEKLQLYQEGKPTEAPDEDGGALALFIPKKDFFITPILIDLNIAVYLVMVFCGVGIMTFHADDLLKWGADYRPLTVNGEWWRLITSMFLHGGLMHIFGNMFGLLFVGAFLEPVLGKAKYLFAYMVTGIIASLASLWWHVATVSVGASGAIFGLYGVFLSLLLLKVFPDGVKKSMLITTLIFVGFNLVYGLTGGIDNAAHIGGLLSGIVLGVILSFTIEKSQPEPGETGALVEEHPE